MTLLTVKGPILKLCGSYNMIIASIPLPYHLRPSILSLSRWIDSERFILFSDDMNIHVIKWNPFIPQGIGLWRKSLIVCSVDSLNALSYDMVEGGSIAAALYPNYLSIQQNGTRYLFLIYIITVVLVFVLQVKFQSFLFSSMTKAVKDTCL